MRASLFDGILYNKRHGVARVLEGKDLLQIGQVSGRDDKLVETNNTDGVFAWYGLDRFGTTSHHKQSRPDVFDGELILVSGNIVASHDVA